MFAIVRTVRTVLGTSLVPNRSSIFWVAMTKPFRPMMIEKKETGHASRSSAILLSWRRALPLAARTAAQERSRSRPEGSSVYVRR